MARPLRVECTSWYIMRLRTCGHVGRKDFPAPNYEGARENKQAGARDIQAL